MPRLGSRVRISFSALRKYYLNAQVAELVDAHVSGACAARRAGSSPVLGTKVLTLYVLFVLKEFGEVAELVDALL